MIVWNEFMNDARVLKEAMTLQSAGYQVTVHALFTPGVNKRFEILSSGIKVVRVARSPFWSIKKKHDVERVSVGCSSKASSVAKNELTLKQLLRVIARSWTHVGLFICLVKSNPSIVHAHDVNTLPTAWLASIITRSPLVYDAHEISTDREGYRSFRKLVGWIEKKLMPRVSATITTTETRAKYFALAYKVPRPLVLQNRPRLKHVKLSDKIRQQLNLEKAWPIVLYQGGLQQGRGLERFVDAAQYVMKAYFVLIGGGRLESSLKDQVLRLGLEGRVFFVDTVPLDELPYYTASADIGVQPIENTCLNHFSTDSNKLFEYMMAGLPIVATSMPEIRRIVRGHGLGLTVEPGNTKALAAAIQRLVDNPQLRAAMGGLSLEASKMFSWEEQEEKLVDLYAGIQSKLKQ